MLTPLPDTVYTIEIFTKVKGPVQASTHTHRQFARAFLIAKQRD
ncbi:MAG: hypothetical protein R3E61_08620 [Pseudomonadales bacterium]